MFSGNYILNKISKVLEVLLKVGKLRNLKSVQSFRYLTQFESWTKITFHRWNKVMIYFYYTTTLLGQTKYYSDS